MIWIVLAIVIAGPVEANTQRSSERETARVSARLLKAVEASQRTEKSINPDRRREIIDTTPDGRKVQVIVFDFE